MVENILVDGIKELIVKHKIKERTIEGFWLNINNAKINDDIELDDIFNSVNKSWIWLEIHSVSLSIINNYSEFIKAELRVYLKDSYIGSYFSVFTLTGEDEDDHYKFEDYTWIRGLIAVEERNEEIAIAAIDENLSDEIINKITGLSIHRIDELKLEKKE